MLIIAILSFTPPVFPNQLPNSLQMASLTMAGFGDPLSPLQSVSKSKYLTLFMFVNLYERLIRQEPGLPPFLDIQAVAQYSCV